ncbi:MAG TPA: DUF4337 domain-containing protein [Bryobacteraceae bacterium]|jgi:hypothetical protein
MAELEIHHEHGHEEDPFGRTIGIMASLLAVLLAIVTILSHRAHTEGVLLKTDANDKWSQYQASRIKFHNLELGEDILNSLPSRTEAANKILERYEKNKDRYGDEGKDIMKDAQGLEKKTEVLEDRALKYDLGEGLLEIGLILTSLYFISKSKMFPAVGLIASIGGIAMALLGLMM